MGAAAAKKKVPQRIYARVQNDGSLVCADQFSRAEMRRMKIKRGALVRLKVSAPRDYTQWKKAHALGTLIAQNISDFEQFVREDGKVDAHGALKHLQRMAGVECEQYETELPGFGKISLHVPQSLAFDEMDETRFQKFYSDVCAFIVKRWWPDMDEAQISQMASLVGMGSP